MRALLILPLVCIALRTEAQTAKPAPPVTVADAAAFSVDIVHRAAQLLDTPAHWNHHDTGACPANATSWSLNCALAKAVDDAVNARARSGGTAMSECRFARTATSAQGSCDVLFDELPIFTMAHANGVTSGRWRDDDAPTDVWSGTMADASLPVRSEGARTVSVVTTTQYKARKIDYNNDSTTTFADMQHYFQVLADRVVANASANLAAGSDSVEIEIHAGGTGVIRTYNGWYPVTGFSVSKDAIRFQVDTARQVPPNALDRRIIERASAILTSEAVWNRADDRKCPDTATTWSIYCAMEKATFEVTGGFHHRRPAAELVRLIVEARSAGRDYQHRLMDYNNDKTTTLADVRSLFAEALGKVGR